MLKLVLPLLFTVSTAAHAISVDTQQDSSQQKPSQNAHEEMHAAMTSMCEGMDSMQMTGSIDHDFLLMMIPHHQSALDMAKAYLKEGVAPEIRAMAESVIAAQQKEIEEMQTWLKEHPVKGQHPHR